MGEGERTLIRRLYSLIACGLLIIYSIPLTEIIHAAYLVASDNLIGLWSEWEMVINYQSGWIRRGLLGSLIQNPSNVNAYALVGAIGMGLYCILLIVLLYRLLGRISFVSIAILTSPFLAWHIIWDFEGFIFRKDYFIYATLLFHALTSLKFTTKARLDYIVLVLIFISVLIHEMAVFTIPAHWLIYHRGNLFDAIRLRLPFVFEWGLFFIGIFGILSAFTPIAADDIATMCATLPESIKARCRVSGPMLSLLKPPKYFFSEPISNPWNSLGQWGFILLIWIVNFAALSRFISLRQKKPPTLHHIISALFAATWVLLPLSFLAIDWGRWLVLSFITALTVLSCATHPLRINTRSNIIPTSLMTTFFILFLIALSVRIPHCCNLEKQGLSSQLWLQKVTPLLKTE